MALNSKKIPTTSKSNFVEQEALEPDSYPARVAQVLDLGLQPQRPYKGEEKPPKHEIMLTYELTDAFMVDEDGEDIPDKPRWISETMPIFSLEADRAKSTKRYMAIDGKQKHAGDFAKLVGMGCSVLVTTYQKDGKVKNAVGDVSPLMRGMVIPELINAPKTFDLDEPDLEVFRSLPEWLQEKIKSNLEFKGSALEALLDGAPAPKKEEEKPAPKKEAKKPEPEAEEEDDNDNPWD